MLPVCISVMETGRKVSKNYVRSVSGVLFLELIPLVSTYSVWSKSVFLPPFRIAEMLPNFQQEMFPLHLNRRTGYQIRALRTIHSQADLQADQRTHPAGSYYPWGLPDLCTEETKLGAEDLRDPCKQAQGDGRGKWIMVQPEGQCWPWLWVGAGEGWQALRPQAEPRY